MEKQILMLYNSGYTCRDIAAALNITTAQVETYLRHSGLIENTVDQQIEMNHKTTLLMINRLYLQGFSIQQIAMDSNVSPTTVGKRINQFHKIKQGIIAA